MDSLDLGRNHLLGPLFWSPRVAHVTHTRASLSPRGDSDVWVPFTQISSRVTHSIMGPTRLDHAHAPWNWLAGPHCLGAFFSAEIANVGTSAQPGSPRCSGRPFPPNRGIRTEAPWPFLRIPSKRRPIAHFSSPGRAIVVRGDCRRIRISGCA
jgi:hypothetical protein